jgi:hypothetical protein
MRYFAGIPNTLNVVSTLPFFFVGLAGLILTTRKATVGYGADFVLVPISVSVLTQIKI